MSDPRIKLRSLFEENNRFNNFGSLLSLMHVQGFRCHNATQIEFNSPITALCGLNGTGKSTLIQLAAAAYRPPNGLKRFYIRDFIVAGKLDANPFTSTASVKYEYLRDRGTGVLGYRPQIVTVSRYASKWTGYKRQPVRPVYFAGMGLYLPKIEHRDFVVRHANKLTITDSGPLAPVTKEAICKILNCGYEAIDSHTVSFQHHSAKVVTVSRNNVTYSEANMGCGEGRVQHIIRVMEALPEKSLVLLEEPETSLHPSAQHEFSTFLLKISSIRDSKLSKLILSAIST